MRFSRMFVLCLPVFAPAWQLFGLAICPACPQTSTFDQNGRAYIRSYLWPNNSCHVVKTKGRGGAHHQTLESCILHPLSCPHYILHPLCPPADWHSFCYPSPLPLDDSCLPQTRFRAWPLRTRGMGLAVVLVPTASQNSNAALTDCHAYSLLPTPPPQLSYSFCSSAGKSSD